MHLKSVHRLAIIFGKKQKIYIISYLISTLISREIEEKFSCGIKTLGMTTVILSVTRVTYDF